MAFFPEFRIGGYDVNLLDLHFFPGHVDKSSSKHLHSFLEFHVPIHGSGNIILENKKYNFEVGDFTVTSIDQVHDWSANESPLISHIWWFQVNQTEEEKNKDIETLFQGLLNPTKPVYKLPDNYLKMYQRLTDQLSETRMCYQQYCLNIIQNIFIDFGRSMTALKRTKTFLKNIDDPGQDHIVMLVNNFLMDNISQPLLLEDIAKNAHISRRNLTRHYKKVTGKTIGHKLHEIRMYLAEELVRETDLQIKAITFKCGFRHLSHFAKKFKEFFGLSPTEYREKIKNESLKGYDKWKPQPLKIKE